jgi:hypothetical protein
MRNLCLFSWGTHLVSASSLKVYDCDVHEAVFFLPCFADASLRMAHSRGLLVHCAALPCGNEAATANGCCDAQELLHLLLLLPLQRCLGTTVRMDAQLACPAAAHRLARCLECG